MHLQEECSSAPDDQPPESTDATPPSHESIFIPWSTSH